VHVAVPVTDLYFPASHTEHVPPLGPVNPTLQTQLVAADEPTGDCELGLQLIQALVLDAPAVLEYVFALQFRHTDAPDACTYLPASQLRHGTDPRAAL
jgi:hypothetical protein